MELQNLKNTLEAILLSADKPMDVPRLENLFELDENRPSRDEIRHALSELETDYQDRGMQLKQVSSGYRMQIPEDYAIWVARLWEEKPPRYSRALLETLVLIAYRQPITRGEIEEIRGVSVSTQIVKTLSEREWIRVLGHKDVPGKPSMYGTTREFLDYFNLMSLDELPALSDIKDLDKIHMELGLDEETELAPEVGIATVTDTDTDKTAMPENAEILEEVTENQQDTEDAEVIESSDVVSEADDEKVEAS